MIETHDMLLIHRVLRREVGALPGLIRAANGKPARARIVGPHTTEMLEFLHVHHTGEDELLWPVLRPRVTLDDGLIDRMEAQHHQVAAAVGDVERELPGWSASADAETGERIAARLDEMNEVLLEHLAEEEQHILARRRELQPGGVGRPGQARLRRHRRPASPVRPRAHPRGDRRVRAPHVHAEGAAACAAGLQAGRPPPVAARGCDHPRIGFGWRWVGRRVLAVVDPRGRARRLGVTRLAPDAALLGLIGVIE
jgi:hypothetical protein